MFTQTTSGSPTALCSTNHSFPSPQNLECGNTTAVQICSLKIVACQFQLIPQPGLFLAPPHSLSWKPPRTQLGFQEGCSEAPLNSKIGYDAIILNADSLHQHTMFSLKSALWPRTVNYHYSNRSYWVFISPLFPND